MFFLPLSLWFGAFVTTEKVSRLCNIFCCFCLRGKEHDKTAITTAKRGAQSQERREEISILNSTARGTSKKGFSTCTTNRPAHIELCLYNTFRLVMYYSTFWLHNIISYLPGRSACMRYRANSLWKVKQNQVEMSSTKKKSTRKYEKNEFFSFRKNFWQAWNRLFYWQQKLSRLAKKNSGVLLTLVVYSIILYRFHIDFWNSSTASVRWRILPSFLFT